jgi:NADP-dependent 3-hydroxy acid dehydrogenase YdfG
MNDRTNGACDDSTNDYIGEDACICMADTHPFDEHVAFVTGASSGIGRAVAQKLAQEGAAVAVAARREEQLETVASTIDDAGSEALVLPTDVTDESEVEHAVERTIDAFGRLDIVVNNAGLGRAIPVEELSTEQYRQMMDVNVDGMFFVTRAAIPYLRETNGTLVFIGSFAGQYPRPDQTVYAATKWWTRGFALSLAGNLGEDDIAVSVVNPTEVRTEFGSEDDEQMADQFEEHEVTEANEVAEAVAFAVRQESPNTAAEIDLYRRDKFSHF